MLASGHKDLCNATGARGSLGRAGKDDCREAYPDPGSIRQEPELSRPTQNWRQKLSLSQRKRKIDGVSHICRHVPQFWILSNNSPLLTIYHVLCWILNWQDSLSSWQPPLGGQALGLPNHKELKVQGGEVTHPRSRYSKYRCWGWNAMFLTTPMYWILTYCSH